MLQTLQFLSLHCCPVALVGKSHNFTPAGFAFLLACLIIFSGLSGCLFVLPYLFFQVVFGVFMHPQLTLICIARLLQAVHDGLNTRHFLFQMLACVTVVCHAGVEGNLWAMFLEPLTSSCRTTGTSAHFSLCPVKFRYNRSVYLFTEILLSLSRWCYSTKLGMEEELGTIASRLSTIWL